MKVNWHQLKVNWNQLKVHWHQLKVNWHQLKVNWNQLNINWNQLKSIEIYHFLWPHTIQDRNHEHFNTIEWVSKISVVGATLIRIQHYIKLYITDLNFKIPDNYIITLAYFSNQLDFNHEVTGNFSTIGFRQEIKSKNKVLVPIATLGNLHMASSVVFQNSCVLQYFIVFPQVPTHIQQQDSLVFTLW